MCLDDPPQRLDVLVDNALLASGPASLPTPRLSVATVVPSVCTDESSSPAPPPDSAPTSASLGPSCSPPSAHSPSNSSPFRFSAVVACAPDRPFSGHATAVPTA